MVGTLAEQRAARERRGKVDRNDVPRFLRGALYGLLIIAGLMSVPQLGSYSPIPVGALLDVWIIVFIVACILRGHTYSTYLLLFLGVYLLTRLIPALATESPMMDFFQAYRWVLYLIAFAFAVGRTWGPVRPLMKVTWALIGLALVKTLVTIVTVGPSKRSGLLIENNFEIALFSGLVALLYSRLTKRARFWTMLMLGVLVMTSGSRSGAIAFAILIVYAVSQAKDASLFVRYLFALAMPVMVFVVVQIFENRAQFGGVDRLNFFGVFVRETQSWDAMTWLFGTTPITPLSAGACDALSYYVNLFSTASDGSCYSVILHAFNMRVVFDAGIFGLVLAVVVTAYALRRGGAERWLVVSLALIAFTNGLSVSGLNSPYVALPILIAIAISNPTPTPDVSLDRLYQRTGEVRV